MREQEYDEAGTHIGNFCENMVNILRLQMGESIEHRPDLGTFVDSALASNIGTSEPKSVRFQIPRVLRAAYDIRNNRDSVHVNLRVPVNHADTQAGIAMCSWMLSEVLRVYGDGDKTSDMREIGKLIEELSEPISEGNPLQKLETSQEDFDRQAVVSALDGVIQIAEGKVTPDRQFSALKTRQQVVALLLGCRVAVDLDHRGDGCTERSWLEGFVEVSGTRVGQIVNGEKFVQKTENGYSIPGYRVQEALDCLEGN